MPGGGRGSAFGDPVPLGSELLTTEFSSGRRMKPWAVDSAMLSARQSLAAWGCIDTTLAASRADQETAAYVYTRRPKSISRNMTKKRKGAIKANSTIDWARC